MHTIKIFSLLFALCLLPSALFSTALSTLANQMNTGTWSDFTMGGLSLSTVTANGPSVPTIVSYGSKMSWDPVHKKIQYAGTSHTGGQLISGAGGLITWDDATNQWSRENYTWSSEAPGHAYYHVTLNKSNGDLYFRGYNSSNVLRRSYGSSGQSSWQSGISVPNAAHQVAGGLEWFSELNNGAGGLVFVDATGAARSNAALSSWTQQSGSATSGNYHNWCAHSGGFIYFGGGNGSNAMYRMNSSGAVTKMADTPMNAGPNSNSAIVLAHPNGTDLLLFQVGSTGAIHRFNGTSWSNIGSHSIGGSGFFIGGPVPDYGVVVFVVHPSGSGTPYAKVYKASAGTAAESFGGGSRAGMDILTAPNPFRGETMILLPSGVNQKVSSLAIYNAQGRQVADLSSELQNKGRDGFSWKSENLPAGIYIARLSSAGKHFESRLILVR